MLGKTSVAGVSGYPPVISRTLSGAWFVEEASNGTPGVFTFYSGLDVGPLYC